MTSAKNNPIEDTSDREIVVTRVFDAPRELVFKAWTDLKNVTHWWGPRGFTTTSHQMDLKPGGVWRFTMHGPDGANYPNKIVFDEIVKPERLTYTHGSDEQPDQFRVTVTFVEQGGKTKLILRSLFPSAEECEQTKKFGAIEGGIQTLERLAEYLPKMA